MVSMDGPCGVKSVLLCFVLVFFLSKRFSLPLTLRFGSLQFLGGDSRFQLNLWVLSLQQHT